MIHMRGDRLDDVLTNVGYDVLAGQWRGVVIAEESFGNRMEYVDMRSTEFGLIVDSCGNLSKRKLLLRNSWLHNSEANVFQSRYAWVDAVGVCFSEAAGATIALEGGKHSILQCTFANNYLFSAIYAPLVWLGHCLPGHAADNANPLMKASFENSVIYGLADDINIGDFTGADVTFSNVSFKAKGSDDANFIQCLWETDPMFYTERPIYYFNYRLQGDSPVKSAGNPEFVTESARYDMDGNDRLGDGAPSLGAYQYNASYVPEPPRNKN